MYRIVAPYGIFMRNSKVASIRSRIERSRRPCTFCNDRHHGIPKHTYNASARSSTSVASLGDAGMNEKVNKGFKHDIDTNNILKEITDADMCFSEGNNGIIGDNYERMIVDEEAFDALQEPSRLEESEMLTTVTFTQLEKEVPLSACQDGKKKRGAMPQFLNKIEYKFNRTFWYCSLMDAYTKTGNAKLARKVFDLARAYKLVKMTDKTQFIYNQLIDSAVRESDHYSAMEIYKFMLEDRIKPNEQTYILLILMIKQLKKNKRKGLLLKIESHMQRLKITFNDLCNKGKFQYDDRSVLIASVRLIYPEFTPSYNFEESTERQEGDISFIKDSKSSYSDCLKGYMNFGDMQMAFKEQIKNEWDGFVEIDNVSLSTEDVQVRKREAQRQRELENTWRGQLSKGFDRHVSELTQMEKATSSLEVLHPYLLLMDKEIYVDCMLRQVMLICKLHHSFAKPFFIIAQELGNRVYRKYEIQQLMDMGVLDKIIDVHYRYLQWYCGVKHLGNTNSRKAWKFIQFETDRDGASSTTGLAKWPTQLASSVGTILMNIILEEVTTSAPTNKRLAVRNAVPVFSIEYAHVNGTLVKQVHCSHQVMKIFKDRGSDKLLFESHELPSKCPPRPWANPLNGGYYISNMCVLRRSLTMNSLQTNLLEAQPPTAMLPIYDSLNMLGAVPWKINEPLLDLILDIFNSGGSEELRVPEPGSTVKDLPDETHSTVLEQRQFNRKQYIQKLKRQAMHSLWCDTLHKLSIANHYRGKFFWLPHNIDFRGRSYPIPPHLSHMSSDLCRSLLLFGQGKPLGPDGLDWLKIHVINLSGRKKKSSLVEKLRYANESIHEIVDSAERPLEGNRWWAHSDTPWQVLSTCMEIAKVLKHPNPEQFVSYLPIHQDGSCNGLQHYAALGRDPFGASSVNLCQAETPQDVYSVIVEQVEKSRKRDAARGVEAAKLLEGFISRKMIKQTIMTTVYGVTFYGARLQISKQLKAVDTFPQDSVYMCSKYLATKTFQSLNSMFTSAKEIQDWLTKCARLIVHDCHRPVEWITPLGLHVLQPYIKTEYTGRGCAQMKSILDTIKQKNAFAPNFIHSLDSTHMMLTGLRCDEAGITFVSVHDCFWTHPCTVTKMNKICREQFVKLHKEPIIEKMHLFFKDYYNHGRSPCAEYSRQFEIVKNVNFPESPQKGEFDIEEVLKSPYFFS